MSDEAITQQLGADTDLLMLPDDWLDNESQSIQQKMALMAEELDRILIAKRVKRVLQQENRVAVRYMELDENGQPTGIVVKICTLPEALLLLENHRNDPNVPSDVARDNANQQIVVWRRDGYDVENSKKIRRRQKD